jgi:hypothetical protein
VIESDLQQFIEHFNLFKGRTWSTYFDVTTVKRYTVFAVRHTTIIWSAEIAAGQWKLKVAPLRIGPRAWQRPTDIAMPHIVPRSLAFVHTAKEVMLPR